MSRIKVLSGAMALLFATAASAQLFQFPPQNPNGPRGTAEQVNYPYPGQCQADTNPLTTPLQWTATACNTTNAPSFACPTGTPVGAVSNFTAGGWRSCGAPVGYTLLQPNPVDPAQKFQNPFLNPFDYLPDTTRFPGADFYDLGLHESWGYDALGAATDTVLGPGQSVVPYVERRFPGRVPVPNGMQWTGLTCNVVGGCTCPAELSAAFQAAYCNGVGVELGKIPFGAPIYTPIWGVGQRNSAGPAIGTILNNVQGLLGRPPVLGTTAPWSANNYAATWPSVSIRAQKGRPVVVRWTNEFPNNHTFCPHPEAADWPCAIDRTFMGVKAVVDPAVVNPAGGWNTGLANPASLIKPNQVNQFGSAQQPDNSWVTHLHGGDIPPATDGFAEKWYGNAVSGALYNPTDWFLTPIFESPLPGPLFRPGFNPARSAYPARAWNADTYTYPMDQEEALIWFHDHTLGKTHHNVIAGPAGFFPVKDPAKHAPVAAGACTGAPGSCDFTWLDPVTEPRIDFGALIPTAVGGPVPNVIMIPAYDFFFALQDRAFNDDGSINFSNGLGQPVAPTAPPEITPITIGDNSLVHPVWIPEYFGDHILVNGILWPTADVQQGWYRIRTANGSDSRCYTLGLQSTAPASGARPRPTATFWVIASDQGYLPQPVAKTSVTYCPGERLELLVNFTGAVGSSLFLTNSAGAPYPMGDTPFTPASSWPDTNVIMRFRVAGTGGVKTCTAPFDSTTNQCMAFPTASGGPGAAFAATAALNTDPELVGALALRNLVTWTAAPNALVPTMCTVPGPYQHCISAVRQLYLNEKFDGTTGAPLGMQINGVPFEYKVTETPRQGTLELWEMINLTVDAHPMHPHLVKHLRIGRQAFDVGLYKTALCGSAECQAGTAPGNEMYVVPDPRNLFLNGTNAFGTNPFNFEPANSPYFSWKDASQILPGETLVILARWDGHYHVARPTQIAANAALANVPGAALGPADLNSCPGVGCDVASWLFEPVTSGPFVWHCHINSHEDSEMMRTSLVVP